MFIKNSVAAIKVMLGTFFLIFTYIYAKGSELLVNELLVEKNWSLDLIKTFDQGQNFYSPVIHFSNPKGYKKKIFDLSEELPISLNNNDDLKNISFSIIPITKADPSPKQYFFLQLSVSDKKIGKLFSYNKNKDEEASLLSRITTDPFKQLPASKINSYKLSKNETFLDACFFTNPITGIKDDLAVLILKDKDLCFKCWNLEAHISEDRITKKTFPSESFKPKNFNFLRSVWLSSDDNGDRINVKDSSNEYKIFFDLDYSFIKSTEKITTNHV